MILEVWKMIEKDIMNQILKLIATDENLSEDEVYQEMQIAINQAYDSEDEDVRKRWQDIPCSQDHPTPEEVIGYLVQKLK